MNVRSAFEVPASREELMRRYDLAERQFPGVDLSGEDLSGVTVDGANFGAGYEKTETVGLQQSLERLRAQAHFIELSLDGLGVADSARTCNL
ncbi:hypothetical protein [Rhizobacter sp. LjRoot28]|uniref:hypothetical protein n=1 Tax=Rhizobacter sp. LjRoot28 TaxID=3342309 RepID=UPI003ECF03B0